MRKALRGLAMNLALTSILLTATVATPNVEGMVRFWYGLVARTPAHILRGAHFLWDVATPLW
jgi:hypothetical protein